MDDKDYKVELSKKENEIYLLKKNRDANQLIIRNQTEGFISDMTKSIVCLSLYLPPQDNLCRNLEQLESDDDFINCMSLLNTAWKYACSPNEIVDPTMGKFNAIESDKLLDYVFEQPKDVFADPPRYYIQLAIYLKYYHRIKSNGFLKMYEDYFETLHASVAVIAGKRLINLNEDFTITPLKIGEDKLKHLQAVADYLVKSECIDEDGKRLFLSLFDKTITRVKGQVVWRKRTSKSKYPGAIFLRILFQSLGYDMDISETCKMVAQYFVNTKGEKMQLLNKGRNISKEQESFRNALREAMSNET